MSKSRIPVLFKKTQLSTNNEEIERNKTRMNSKPAVTNELREKKIMFKPRYPALDKKTQNSTNIGTIKTKEKKTYSKSAITNNQASCVKKFQTQPVNRNQVKYLQPSSSQTVGERKRRSVAISKQPKVVTTVADREQGKKAEAKEEGCPEKENAPESKENDANFNEDFRQFILSGKELTPSMLNRESGAKYSLNRPSSLIYRPFIVPADPYKEALKAIENYKSNPRPSQVKRSVIFTPMKESRTYSSNPYEEALKSIEILKQRRKGMKNKKKVTFDLQAVSVPLHSTQQQRKELQPPGESAMRLSRINELDESSMKSARESSLKISTLAKEVVHQKDTSRSVPMSSKYSVKNKILTPCPVSCKPQSLENSGSPELFGEKSKETHYVPKKNEVEVLSNIRLKLNFNDVDLKYKEEKSLTCMESSVICDTNNGILLRDVSTARNVLDHLADEECSVIFLRQKLPIVCGRSMRSPVLIILREAEATKEVLENEASISKVIKVPVINLKEDDVKHLIPLGSL